MCVAWRWWGVGWGGAGRMGGPCVCVDAVHVWIINNLRMNNKQKNVQRSSRRTLHARDTGKR
jgi:hypothetical protein